MCTGVVSIKIRDMFVQPIDRDIKGVIKVGQTEEENLKQELEEYVVTNEVRKHIGKFYDSFNKSIDRPYDKMGVWISGFFGSGKSHLLKILAALLENGEVDRQTAIDYIAPKLEDPMLEAEMRRAASVPKDVVLFNIDSKSDASSYIDRPTVVEVFARVFFEHLGLCSNPTWLGYAEWKMIQRGFYEDFCQEFERVAGAPWTVRRETAMFEEDNIAQTMRNIGILGENSQSNFITSAKQFYEMSPEDFALMVREHLKSQGPDHKIVFLVDEMGQYIANDERMILNLQTLAEDLGTHCHGRAWIAVTSQQAIDEVATEIKSKDFSKILGRFDTRLSLSSANVDEVIKKRLLEKTPVAHDTLTLFYHDKEAVCRNLFAFSDGTPGQRLYASPDEFAENYPFVPYQFDLLQSVFEEIRKHGASGKHLAKGARSMLSAVQETTLAIADCEHGILIPFNRFYDSMEEFLEPSVREIIERAKANPDLEPMDAEVLKTLFMLKYITNEMPPTRENVTVLMLASINQDKLALRNSITESLDRLTRQNLVQKDGDLYIFLTDDEQEIDREISRVKLDESMLCRHFYDTIFASGEIFKAKKIRYKNVYDFDFYQRIDSVRFGSAKAEIGMWIVTPFSYSKDDPGELEEILRESALAPHECLMVLEHDKELVQQAESYLKLDTYLKNKSRAHLPTNIEEILQNRDKQRNRLKDASVASIRRAISNADFYINGRKLDLRSRDPKSRMIEALERVVPAVYTKIDYMQYNYFTTTDLKHLQSRGRLEQLDANRRAVDEIRQFIEDTSSQALRVTMKTIVDRFTDKPYGWLHYDIAGCVITLLLENEIVLAYEGSRLDEKDRRLVDYLTKYSEMDRVLVQHKRPDDDELIQAIREASFKIFDKANLAGETEDDVVSEFCDLIKHELGNVEDLKRYYKSSKYSYPGRDILDRWTAKLRSILQLKDTQGLKMRLKEDTDELASMAHQDVSCVKGFFKNQVEYFEKGLTALRLYDDNSIWLSDATTREAAGKLRNIIESPAPYEDISRIPELVETINKDYQRALDQARSKSSRIVLEHKKTVENRVSQLLAADGPEKDAVSQIATKAQREFDLILNTVEGSNSLSHVIAVLPNSEKLAHDVIEQLDSITLSPVAPTMEAVSFVEVVRSTSLGSNGQLKTVHEVECFIEELGQALKEQVANGIVVRLKER